MTQAILIGGVIAAAVLAAAMIDRRWRLPALTVAVLSIPGNVDNLLPQMLLDPHPLPDNTAPAISVIDLLIGWAAVLTLREERRRPRLDLILLIGLVLTALAAASAVAAVASGVDGWSALRGVLVFGRIVALLYLAGALVSGGQELFRLALACAVGAVALLGNAIYTSSVTGDQRLTASTFGRNSLAVALVLIAIICAAAMFDRIRRRPRRDLPSALAPGLGVVAASAIFAAVATGTRMSLFVLVGAGIVGLIANHGWRSPAGVGRAAVVTLAVVAVVATSALLSEEGARTISVITDPGTTVDVVTNPGSLPTYSEVRSRGEFWDLAIQMARSHPLFGVGPYQWNFERYQLATYEPVVADAHNSYLQVAAEFGLPTLVTYLLLIGLVLGRIFRHIADDEGPLATSWLVAAFAAAGLAYLGTELTNSHLFNVRVGVFGWLILASSLAVARGPTSRPPWRPAWSARRRHDLDAGTEPQ